MRLSSMTEEIKIPGVEEVTLSMTRPTGVGRENDDITPRKERDIGYGLKQYSKLRGKHRMIYVFNRRYLAFHENEKPEIVVDMAVVAAKPRITFKFAWIPALIALSCISVAGAKLYFQQSGADLLSFEPFNFEINLGLFLAGLFFLMITVFLTSYRAVFYTLNGGVDLFQLYVNLPDKRGFRQLLNKLNESISQANKRLADDEFGTAKEVEEHRRLYDSKMISQKVYDQAKQKLFSR